MKFSFHPEAEIELMQAVEYYEDCQPGLGEDFVYEVFAAVKNILSYPEAWPVVAKPLRRCLVSRFPYGILYHKDDKIVSILAVMHLHRHPDYWKNRK